MPTVYGNKKEASGNVAVISHHQIGTFKSYFVFDK